MNALFVAWRPSDENSGWRPVGRLDHEHGLYRFRYTQGAQEEPFQPFAGMNDIRQVYESEQLLPLFKNRLLPKSRPEYQDYLRWSGFDPLNERPDPIVELGVTEGIRQTDAVEVFPCPTPDADGCYLNKFFLHGIRWVEPSVFRVIDALEQGERLYLMLDVQNASDRYAVAVRSENPNVMLGYVPRYLARDVWQLFEGCCNGSVDICVERVNPGAPAQNRLLCSMRACWPDGFEPCSGDEFQPILAPVTAVAK